MQPNFKKQKDTDKKYLHFFRYLPCCYKGNFVSCSGDVVAAHVRIGSCCGIGTKPYIDVEINGEVIRGDKVIPLCFAHHNFQHQKGELYFHSSNLPYVDSLSENLLTNWWDWKDIDLYGEGLIQMKNDVRKFMKQIRGMK